MKIGFISQPWDSGGPPDPGGSIGLLTWEIARRLGRVHEVFVCGPRWKGQPPTERCDGVNYIRFAQLIDHRILAPMRRVWRLSGRSGPDFASTLYYAAYVVRAARALRAADCDVVHIHNFSQFVPIVRRLCPRAKTMLHMNCDWLVQLDRGLVDGRLNNADAIVGCCEYITDNIRRRFIKYADRCNTLYNGADIGAFAPRDEASSGSSGARILYVGRVSPEKGLHVLLDAFELIAADHPEARLEIVGGEYVPPMNFIVGVSSNPDIKALSRFYGHSYMQYLRSRVGGPLEGRVSFAGALPHCELAERLRNADMFAQPSVWSEPFPLSVVEAMAAGLPVVASRAGGLPEAIEDNETGLLVDPGNPGALARALLRLIDDRRLARMMGRAGRGRASRMFSWENITATLEGFYETLCRDGSVASRRASENVFRDAAAPTQQPSGLS